MIQHKIVKSTKHKNTKAPKIKEVVDMYILINNSSMFSSTSKTTTSSVPGPFAVPLTMKNHAFFIRGDLIFNM